MPASVVDERAIPLSNSNSFEQLDADLVQTRRLLIEFASNSALCSARAAEISEETSFVRRPVRVEDFEHIDFATPLSRDRATSLAALTAQRLLLCINELEACRPTATPIERHERRRDAFYSEQRRLQAASIRPFLEHFAFSRIGALDAGVRCVEELHGWIETARDFWRELAARLSDQSYVSEGLRFVLIQKACLHRAKCAAVDIARVLGYFDGLRSAELPRLQLDNTVGTALASGAARSQLSRQEHSYWQFYLPTSLAEVNVLYALRQPRTPLRIVGAAFAMEADVAALTEMLQAMEACDRIATLDFADVVQRFSATVQALRLRGGAAIREFMAGFAVARSVCDSAHADLNAQLSWVSRIEDYLDAASEIRERIRSRRSAIPRETFNEPREMCSTTHVHDDHRLVEIESGRMVFWANFGMRLCFDPGEVLFVPRGRLHGSSVESDVCRYHQPILPEEWVKPFMGWRSNASRPR